MFDDGEKDRDNEKKDRGKLRFANIQESVKGRKPKHVARREE